MSGELRIRSLVECPEHAPLLAEWFRGEWDQHFRNWNAQRIIGEFFTPARASAGLPVVLIADIDGKPCGTVMLRAQWRESHAHLGPWLGGLFVLPEYRSRAIARKLIETLAAEAGKRGYTEVYAGTKNLGRFLRTLGWQFQEMIGSDKESIGLFRWRPPSPGGDLNPQKRSTQ
ncbi:MAG TPA: GNAT family N-acetyltransferase [Steroidobacteraceae bacterium]|nr:GNAT family N-acetyltransferase [Steroidobacteraceae bacterium]